MTASLVVILPTAHEGGSLILRQGGKEWTFDSAEAVGTTPSMQAAFVVSFSNVEHEMKTVTSGFQVTLTYNLYLKKENSAVIFKQVENDLELKEALTRLLKDPDSFPNGGFIGFGLSHKYPFDMDKTVLSDIKEDLKGSDATIKRACDLLSLAVSIKAVYVDEDDDDFLAVLLDKITNIEYRVDGPLLYHLEEDYEGHVVEDHKESEDWKAHEQDPIVWIRPLANTNGFKFTYLTEDYKWPLTYADGEVCMVATIPAAEERVSISL